MTEGGEKIVLDTNVVSELRRTTPNPNVFQWAAQQPSETLYITTVTEAELWYGMELLPASRYRRELTESTRRMINDFFDQRILSFDSDAAQVYAEIRASRRLAGRVIGELDCMIAAIAKANEAAVATRDTGGFENCGVEVVNPWGN